MKDVNGKEIKVGQKVSWTVTGEVDSVWTDSYAAAEGFETDNGDQYITNEYITNDSGFSNLTVLDEPVEQFEPGDYLEQLSNGRFKVMLGRDGYLSTCFNADGAANYSYYDTYSPTVGLDFFNSTRYRRVAR